MVLQFYLKFSQRTVVCKEAETRIVQSHCNTLKKLPLECKYKYVTYEYEGMKAQHKALQLW